MKGATLQENNEQALQEAIDAHMAGKLEVAEHIYRAILQIQPNHPDANHNLGVLAVSVNKPEVALALFKTALETNPNQGQFWISYVATLIKTNHLDIAKNVIEQGKKLGLAGEKVDALEAQLKPTALVQNSESALQKQHLSLTQQHKKVSAKKEKKKNFLSNVVSSPNQVRSPSQMEVNGVLENYQKGRYDLAENLAKTITQKYPDNQFGWKALAAVFKKTGRLQETLVASQRVVAISPNDAEVHYNLGVTLQELGRLEEAEASYKKAIAIKPDFAEARYNLANTLKELGKLEDAVTSYKKTIAIKPGFAEAHSNLGVTLQELGRLEDAEACYKKALAIKPDLAEAHSNLGSALKELGRLQDAEACYKKAIATKPDYAEAYSNLGVTLRELGKLEEAEISCKEAIAIKPDYAEAHSNLGVILKELGRVEEAEESYAQAVKLKPDNIKARSGMLDCLYRMDKKLLFLNQLEYLTKQANTNSTIGSLTCRSALRYGEGKPNIFCNEPLKHVLLVDLKSRYNFDEIFVQSVKSILGEDKKSNRIQPLLLSGYQTSGNLLGIENKATDQIQKAIRLEIERYRINFENSQEGFIRKWPSEYSLNGWLISMKSGGQLHPHIHENGWLSGSIYINVPPKSKIDSGNLVVAIGKDSDTTNSHLNLKKVLDVVTGNMVLFPASLMHYTIPFESEEDRIVLAFDVVPA